MRTRICRTLAAGGAALSLLAAAPCAVAEEATGFFHVESAGGIDWVIDPAGRATTIRGIDTVRPFGWKDRKLGYDVYARFTETNYPSREAWVDETLGRLGDWGFNALCNHCDEPLLRGRSLAHTITLYLGGKFAAWNGKDPDRWITPWRGPCTGIPNVFHPDFERAIRARARELCAPERDNPHLLGWFLDNELKWWGVADKGRKDLALFDTVAALPPTHSARKALDDFLTQRRRDAEERECPQNTNLRASVSPCDNNPDNPVNPVKENYASSASLRLCVETAGMEVKAAFLRHFAERYFSVLCGAIREADPNHMILGCRFAGPFTATHPVVWEACGKYCDIASFNYYPWADIDRGVVLDQKGGRRIEDRLREVHGWCGRPLMVSEWSFPALDTGRPCFHGAGQRFRTQGERARATAFFARTMAALPFVAGSSYFMWLDQPASGISETFREDSNYGLVNEHGVPYAEVAAALRAANREAEEIHATGIFNAETQRRGADENVANVKMLPISNTNDQFGTAGKLEIGKMGIGNTGNTGNNYSGSWRLSSAFVRLSGAVGEGRAVREIAFASGGAGGPPAGGEQQADNSKPEGGPPAAPAGSLAVCLEWNGPSGPVWTQASRVTAAETAEADRREARPSAILLRCEGGESGISFAIPLLVSLDGGSASFSAEILGVENTGDAPFDVSAVFLMPFPAGSPPVPVPVVPNLWGADAESWWRLPDGGAWGAVSSCPAATFRFWVRDNDRHGRDGSVHPDCRFRAAVEAVPLAPGQTWRPPVPFTARILRRPNP